MNTVPDLDLKLARAPICRASALTRRNPIELADWAGLSDGRPMPSSRTCTTSRPWPLRIEMRTSPLRLSGKACLTALDSTSFKMRTIGVAASKAIGTCGLAALNRNLGASGP